MPSRYNDVEPISSQHCAQIGSLLEEMFPHEHLLESFVNQNFGRDLFDEVLCVTIISMPLALMSHQHSKKQIGLLLEHMSMHQPHNQKVADLLAYLVEAGYLHDAQAANPARKFRKVRWHRDPDRFTSDRLLVDLIVRVISATTFQTNAELESFLIGSFTGTFARNVVNKIIPCNHIQQNVYQVVSWFARVRRLTALITAAYQANKTNVGLLVLLRLVQQSNKQAAQSTPPNAPTEATAATTQPAPRPLTVTAVCKKPGKAEQDELVELMLRSFDARGLREIAHDMGESLNHITPADAMRPMTGRLVRWCLDQNGSAVALLNAIIKRCQQRADVPVFIKKLSDNGYITVKEG
jgi:hypothetical protein